MTTTTAAQLRGDADSLRLQADTLDHMSRERQDRGELQDARRFRCQANAKRDQANSLDDAAQALQRAEFFAELADREGR